MGFAVEGRPLGARPDNIRVKTIRLAGRTRVKTVRGDCRESPVYRKLQKRNVKLEQRVQRLLEARGQVQGQSPAQVQSAFERVIAQADAETEEKAAGGSVRARRRRRIRRTRRKAQKQRQKRRFNQRLKRIRQRGRNR